MKTKEFQTIVWKNGQRLYRQMPWRDEPSLYYVLVSEVMLQQTQVPRVLVKFDEFIRAFPTIQDLASASLADVLGKWSGLGYNRRAKFLHDAAKIIVAQGEPTTPRGLVLLPGVGKNTAAAIMNYVHNTPTTFIETNIRTVYFHHFFPGVSDVTDRQLLELVQRTMPQFQNSSHPGAREWFWALMDYGALLKSQRLGRPSQSRHYKKQSPLVGSVREIRGKIIAELTLGDMKKDQLQHTVQGDGRFSVALDGLMADGLVMQTGELLHLTR